MDKIKVKSKYTEAEIEKNFKDVDFFDGVMSGLEDALAYKNGLAKAATIVRKRSLPVIDVVGVRRDLNMTQRDFAWVLGVSVRTVESWEIGRSVRPFRSKNWDQGLMFRKFADLPVMFSTRMCS